MTHGHFRGHFCKFLLRNWKEPALYIFFQNIHLLSFLTIYSLPCVPLKWRAHEFFLGGHGRTPTKVRSNHNISITVGWCVYDNANSLKMKHRKIKLRKFTKFPAKTTNFYLSYWAILMSPVSCSRVTGLNVLKLDNGAKHVFYFEKGSHFKQKQS